FISLSFLHLYSLFPYTTLFRSDVYVINTCTVTNSGDKKSRQVIRRAVRKNPDAIICVTGCYAQTSPGEIIEIPGVDVIVGTQDRDRKSTRLNSSHDSISYDVFC